MRTTVEYQASASASASAKRLDGGCINVCLKG